MPVKHQTMRPRKKPKNHDTRSKVRKQLLGLLVDSSICNPCFAQILCISKSPLLRGEKTEIIEDLIAKLQQQSRTLRLFGSLDSG